MTSKIGPKLAAVLLLLAPAAGFAGADEEPRLFRVFTGEGMGFADRNGEVVIAGKFRYVRPFSEGLAVASAGDRQGFIDGKGKWAIEPEFDSVRDFADGRAAAKKGDKWGYLDGSGRWAIPARYDAAADFAEGAGQVKTGEKWGFVDRSGREMIAPRYENAGPFSDGLAAVEVNGMTGFIDKRGRTVIAPRYNGARSFHEGLAAVQPDEMWGFIDRKGKMVIAPKYADAKWFDGGMAAVAVGAESGSGMKYGYINRSGDWAIEPRFDDAAMFAEDMAAVKVNRRWGFIDRNGQVRVRPMYSRVEGFENGLANVSALLLDAYVDEEGVYVWPKWTPLFPVLGAIFGFFAIYFGGAWLFAARAARGMVRLEPIERRIAANNVRFVIGAGMAAAATGLGLVVLVLSETGFSGVSVLQGALVRLFIYSSLVCVHIAHFSGASSTWLWGMIVLLFSGAPLIAGAAVVMQWATYLPEKCAQGADWSFGRYVLLAGRWPAAFLASTASVAGGFAVLLMTGLPAPVVLSLATVVAIAAAYLYPGFKRRYWGMRPLAGGPVRSALEDLIETAGFPPAEILTYETAYGPAAEVNVTGIFRRGRFVSVSREAAGNLSGDEIRALLAAQLWLSWRKIPLLLFGLAMLGLWAAILVVWPGSTVCGVLSTCGTKRALLVAAVASVFLFPVMMVLAGTFRAADRYAVRMTGSPEPLLSAFIKLGDMNGPGILRKRGTPGWRERGRYLYIRKLSEKKPPK